MKFIVIEIQTNSDGTVGNIVQAFDTQEQAESTYHSILASAAISKLPVHAAALMTNEGYCMEYRCYKHGDE